ncbi:uncharacterized protein LACBIDRAFT_332743 [Laccaria bicolor S238N-H82]|uniref:Predicted protein n=1 Tax=Laccaria bicolor (strain S238N-H82 / ATCC MYA-4686) TaxID=486041 RepID=B0DTY1_LACBS|nr:uncharacterized protein LACBIDRAFT_332743 [Laccaria bicolor S238N-H82]EDR01928.1 predicted protein [Laccaria bicolor S238N-H82]|eukprot:XP_001887319.1 predicted protein [Laccaria bicolor S238N-H82]
MQRKQPANDDQGPTNDHDPLATTTTPINETTTGKQRPAPRTIDDQRPGRPRKSTSGAHHGPQTTNDPTSQLGHVAVGDVATTRHRRTTTMSSSVYIGYAVDRPLAIDGQHPPHHHATPPQRKGHAARRTDPNQRRRKTYDDDVDKGVQTTDDHESEQTTDDDEGVRTTDDDDDEGVQTTDDNDNEGLQTTHGDDEDAMSAHHPHTATRLNTPPPPSPPVSLTAHQPPPLHH